MMAMIVLAGIGGDDVGDGANDVVDGDAGRDREVHGNAADEWFDDVGGTDGDDVYADDGDDDDVDRDG